MIPDEDREWVEIMLRAYRNWLELPDYTFKKNRVRDLTAMHAALCVLKRHGWHPPANR